MSAPGISPWLGRAGMFTLLLAAAIAAFILIRRRGARIVEWLAKRLPASISPRAFLITALAVGVGGVFGAIAEEVLDRETSVFDRSVSLWVHGLDSPFMDFTMRLFTAIGSFRVVIVAAVLTLADALRRRDRRAAWTLAAVYISAEAINWVLKHLVGRARPTLFEEIATLHTYSFPSGHAMTGAAVYGMVGVILARAYPRCRKLVMVLVPALVFLIGLSRVFLGVHWPTDVLAGWAAGMTLLLIGVVVLEARDLAVK